MPGVDNHALVAQGGEAAGAFLQRAAGDACLHLDGVVLINLGQEEIHLPLVKDGKDVPIAQIIFEFYNNVNFKIVDNLEETQRGEGGFGSSDKKFNITEKKSESLKENSNLVDKWKKTGASENPIPPKYETVVREREKQIS